MPDIHSCFRSFKSAKAFTSLDLNLAYHKIWLTGRSKPLTTFAICIAAGAQILTRLLDQVFSDTEFKFLFHYVDDLVVYSNSFEKHLRDCKGMVQEGKGGGTDGLMWQKQQGKLNAEVSAELQTLSCGMAQ
jgi:hypothetical protein